MLEGMKAQRCDGCGFRVSEDAEHAALLAKRVAVQILVQIMVEIVVGFGGGSGRPIARKGFHMIHRTLVKQD